MREGAYKAEPGHRPGEWQVVAADGTTFVHSSIEVAADVAVRMNHAWEEGYAAAAAEAAKVVQLRPLVNIAPEVLALANSAATLVTHCKQACDEGLIDGRAAWNLGSIVVRVVDAIRPFAEAEAAAMAAAAQETPPPATAAPAEIINIPFPTPCSSTSLPVGTTTVDYS
jgi:hypothetical protein